jgi:hypothetical protein
MTQSFEDVVLEEQLRQAIERINPDIQSSAREDAVKQILPP